MNSGNSPREEIRVWDPLVRVAHWTLVLSVAAAWLTEESGAMHEWMGYVALAVVLARVLWGLAGSRYARFSQFVASPAATLYYARAVLAGVEQRHVGHNPLGAWMIVALFVMVLLAAGTGWLYTTDRFWGVEWVEELHEGTANALLLLVALHIGGVIFSSLRHGENLVAAMFNGRKRAPGPGDID